MASNNQHVVVVGIGYVGLPLAIMLARNGYRVTGVDKNQDVIAAVNDGALPLAEDDIRRVFAEPEVQRNFHAQTDLTSADAFIISVPTPLDERKRIADLSHVVASLQSIVPHLQPGNLVIIESTVPPLTCREVAVPILESSGLKVSQDIFLCHCPERILPGNVFEEIVHNDRLIGGLDQRASELAYQIYASFVKGSLYVTDDVTAELVKLMENTYRDVNIALANEFAAVAEGLGVDPIQALELANKHPRVHILYPGIGAGGHCIPIDPWFIKQVDPVNSRLIHTARQVNDELPFKIAARIRASVRDIPTPRIVALGVTYKPNTYDTRNSPALRIVELLRADGYCVEAYDPLADGYQYDRIATLARDADCLVALVEHAQVVEELDACWDEVQQTMRHPIILRFYPRRSVPQYSPR